MTGIADEIEVINSIYEGAAQFTASQSVVDLRIPDTEVEIRLWLPSQYPDEAPKPVKVSGVLSSAEALASIQNIIDSTFEPGEVYIFSFIDEVRAEAERLEAERIEHDQAQQQQQQQQQQQVTKSSVAHAESGAQPSDKWAKSAEIKDRSSTFVGYAIRVERQEDIKLLRADLISDKKLQGASHHMTAWRIRLNAESTLYDEDYDNDGEAGSGPMMLNVLQMTRAENVLVVVARYFNGTHIGSDRFRHIKNCTKAALVEGNFVNK